MRLTSPPLVLCCLLIFVVNSVSASDKCPFMVNGAHRGDYDCATRGEGFCCCAYTSKQGNSLVDCLKADSCSSHGGKGYENHTQACKAADLEGSSFPVWVIALVAARSLVVAHCSSTRRSTFFPTML